MGDAEPGEGVGKAVLSLTIKVQGSKPRTHLAVGLAYLLVLEEAGEGEARVMPPAIIKGSLGGCL